LTKIKELLSELAAFLEIKADIKKNLDLTQEARKNQTRINGDLSKYQSMEKDVISMGLFKKKNKKDLINELEVELKEVAACFI
jgi:fructose-1-phosphate kinase PfkB-like protein